MAFADCCLCSPVPTQAVTFTPCPSVLLPPCCSSFLQGYPAVSCGALATDRFVFPHGLSSEQDTASVPPRVVPASTPIPKLSHLPYQDDDSGGPGTSGEAGDPRDALNTVTVPRLKLKKHVYHPCMCYICVLHCVYSPQIEP